VTNYRHALFICMDLYKMESIRAVEQLSLVDVLGVCVALSCQRA